MFGSHTRPGMRGSNSLSLGSLSGSTLAGSTLGHGGHGSLGADEPTNVAVSPSMLPPQPAAAPAPRATNWLLVGAAGLAAYLILKKR